MIKPYFSSLLLEQYRDDIISYTRKNFCCEKFPKCNHPLFQSDKNIFKDPKFVDIKNEYYELVKVYLQKDIEIVYEFVWSYLSLKNQTINRDTWHCHFQKEFDVDAHVSGILYFENSSLGTEFKNDNFRYITKAEKNRWYLWGSELTHRPEPGINKKERLCIATATGVKFKR